MNIMQLTILMKGSQFVTVFDSHINWNMGNTTCSELVNTFSKNLLVCTTSNTLTDAKSNLA